MLKARLMRFLFVLFTVAALSLSGVWAAEPPGDEDESGGEEGDFLSKISIHGYLTQAWAKSSDYQILGIPEDGTFDYRTAALQVRYDHDKKNVVIIQLSHERMGESPYMEFEDAVELDWAFYQYLFTDHTWVKVGKIQIPFGIYNEIRDVGILLPFYRVPSSYYGETFYATEALNGTVFSHTFFNDKDWNFEANGFVGGWSVLEAGIINEAKVDIAGGCQFWLGTPVDGLRFGLGGKRMRIRDRVEMAPEDKQYWNEWNASLDGTFNRFDIRGEYRETEFDSGLVASNYYGLVSFRPIQKLGVHVQYEMGDQEFVSPYGDQGTLDIVEDMAVGLSYAFKPNLVLKAEYHWTDGFTIDELPDDWMERFFANEGYETDYAIVSLSVAF